MHVTLCVLFNHPFPRNIPKLRSLLADRFSDILFVQPLAASDDKDVITSYRGSYSFHGLVVDAAPELLRRDSDYYVFVQDDVLLNPLLNEDTIISRLCVEDGGAFHPGFSVLGGDIQNWAWSASVVWKLFYPMNAYSGSGVEDMLRYLPDATVVREALATKYGFDFPPITYNRDAGLFQHGVVGDAAAAKVLNRAILDGLFATPDPDHSITLPYPFCYGMSDMFAVNKETLRRAVPLLGILAASQIFVEVAIPTVLATVADRVSMSTDVGLYPDWVWGQERNNIPATETASRFEEDLLLVHPVKLSRDEALAIAISEALRTKRA